MKHLILFSSLLFSLLLTSQNLSSSTERLFQNNLNSKAPCFKLYTNNTSTNSDEFNSIRLTKVSDGSTQLYVVYMNQNGLVAEGAGTWCGTFDITINASFGGLSSAIGIKNKTTGVVYYCQSGICCGDSQIFTINNVPLSSPFGTSWEVFLYNGPC